MSCAGIDDAVRRIPKDATAWSARDATWSMVIAGIDPDPTMADRLKASNANRLAFLELCRELEDSARHVRGRCADWPGALR
jgi:hypothetical protein